jgi:hypothetical protein
VNENAEARFRAARLLRSERLRPEPGIRCRAAKKCDEFSSPHGLSPETQLGTALIERSTARRDVV